MSDGTASPKAPHEHTHVGRPRKHTRKDIRPELKHTGATSHHGGVASHEEGQHTGRERMHSHSSSSMLHVGAPHVHGHPYRRIDNKQRRAVQVVLLWANKSVQAKIVDLSKAFNRWKFAKVALAHSDTSLDEGKTSYMRDQKNSYLQLFAENEKLREQLSDMKKTTIKNERDIRAQAFQSLLRIIWRSRLTAKIRYYYDIWFNNTKMCRLVASTHTKSMELEVGLQRIESERNYVTMMDKLNAQLKISLSMTIYFFKWKSLAANSILSEERRLYDKQRSVIFNELQRVRKIVSSANAQEKSVLCSALGRGEELTGSLISLRDRLERATLLAKDKGTVATTTTSGLNNSSITTVANVSAGGRASPVVTSALAQPPPQVQQSPMLIEQHQPHF